MATPVTVAAYTEISEAEDTVSKLVDGGVPAEKISVLAKDMQCEKQVHGFVTSCLTCDAAFSDPHVALLDPIVKRADGLPV